jgi:hypothetical protein
MQASLPAARLDSQSVPVTDSAGACQRARHHFCLHRSASESPPSLISSQILPLCRKTVPARAPKHLSLPPITPNRRCCTAGTACHSPQQQRHHNSPPTGDECHHKLRQRRASAPPLRPALAQPALLPPLTTSHPDTANPPAAPDGRTRRY